MLDVNDLHFDYQDQPVLQGVSFHLQAGELLHLKGANGAGKTTLFKLITGLYLPAQGSVAFAGEPITNQLATYQKQFCFIGHKSGINPYLTLHENCMYDMHYAERPNNIDNLSAIFNLEDYLDIPCGLLSAGQRRQVALLRLWMSETKLWLLDEPFVALDTKALAILMKKIELHRQQGGAVLLTSHQPLSLNNNEYKEYQL